MASYTVDPIRIIEIKGQIYTVASAIFDFAAGNNQSIIAASSTGRHRILGWTAQSNNAANGAIRYKNGSGGTSLTGSLWMPDLTLPPFHLPIFEGGYFETSTNTALVADIATQPVSGQVYYITYVP